MMQLPFLDKRLLHNTLGCPRLGFFEARDRKTLRDESLTTAQQIQFLHGRMVGTRARKEFSGGFLIEERRFDQALRETEVAVERGEKILFEAAAASERIAIRADILVCEEDQPWALWEVKSGTEQKEEYLIDLAVQIHVLEGNGHSVRGGLILVDREATAGSPTILKRLDCDAEARAYLPALRDAIALLERAFGEGSPPPAVLERRCRDCAYQSECWPGLPERNILELYQGEGGWRAIETLLQRGVFDLSELPFTGLTRIQKRQLQAILSGTPVLEEGLPDRLARKLRHPLCFLDFEAARSPIPEFPGQHPYDLIPFQWSCHIQAEPESPLEHFAYLKAHAGDPRREMTEALLECLRDKGTIVVYSDFEQEVIRTMGEVFPDLAADLHELSTRLFDLLKVLRRHYYHPGFHGSFSIKSVLPVLVPGRGYEGMAVSDGMEAVLAYYQLVYDDLSEVERERVANNLLDYCKQDSLAMYEIYQALLSVSGEK